MRTRADHLHVLATGLCIALAPCLLAAQDPLPAPGVATPSASPQIGNSIPTDDSVLSATRQFRVKGGDTVQLRASVASLAEDVKSGFLQLIEDKDDWKTPVYIQLHDVRDGPAPAHPVTIRLVEISTHRELRIDAGMTRGIDNEAFADTIVSSIVYDRSLARLAAGDSIPLDVPPWLATGITEAVAWSRRQGDRNLYAAVFKSGGLFQLDNLLDTTQPGYVALDGASRAAFRVSSGALVMALLEQSQGKQSFRDFIQEVAAYAGEMPALLRKRFPELNLSENSLAKWWQLQLAAKGALNDITDAMSIRESDAALTSALVLRIPSEDGLVQPHPIQDWRLVTKLPKDQLPATIRQCEESLVRLSYRCFPSSRPLLKEYHLIIQDLVRGKTTDIDSRLKSLAETRTLMLAKYDRARDYLDWFEITRASEISGDFDQYVRLKDSLSRSTTRKRNDKLSSYLDRMDKLFAREGMPETSDHAFGLDSDLPPLPPDQLPPLPGSGSPLPLPKY